MNRVIQLVRTEAVALDQFDHPADVSHRDPARECATGHHVNFLEAGSFRVRTTGMWQELDRRRLFVTSPGLEFSCAHAEDRPPTDRCLSVRYSDDAIESARGFVTTDHAPVRPLTNRQAYLHVGLRGCAPGDGARAEALAGALLWSLASATSRQPLYRADRLAWYAARIERAKALMASHFDEPLSLSRLARDAGMSLFHFARIFAELEGLPPHRFLTGVRLAAAHARLRDGAAVTETCFAVGFGSLSHFVTAFRRQYGVRPSAVRAATRRARV